MIPVYHPYILELLDMIHEQPGIGTTRLCLVSPNVKDDIAPELDKDKRRCLKMLCKGGFVNVILGEHTRRHHFLTEKGNELRTHLWAIRYLVMGDER